MKSLYLALAILIVSSAAPADSVWDISGQIGSAGNNRSTIFVDFAYSLDIGAYGNLDTFALSNESVSGGGSLGDSFTIGNHWNSDVDLTGYVPIYDAEGDEIDIVGGPAPFVAYWYKCVETCIADFMPTGYSQPIAWNAVDQGAAPFTLTEMAIDPPSTPTPEPSTIILLIVGLAFIFLLTTISRRNTLRPSHGYDGTTHRHHRD